MKKNFSKNKIKFNNKKKVKIGSGKNGGRKFKWWMIIPIVLVIAIAITVVVFVLNKKEFDNQISEIEISSMPDKMVFYIGEEFSATGFTVTTKFNNGKEFTEGPEACTFSGFNSEFPEKEQQITVTYGERTFYYTVEIKERPRPFSPLVKISLESLPKTEYKVGEWMDVNDGVLLLEYEDGSTRRMRLEHKYVYNFSTDVPGTFTVTIKYREDGFLQTCTYEITVTE